MAVLTALLLAALAAAAPSQEVARRDFPGPGGLRFSAVIERAQRGTTLEIYALDRRSKRLVYVHPYSGEIQRFVGLGPKGYAPDFGDAVPSLVYASASPAFGRTKLYVLRYRAPYFVRVADFPEGRLDDLAGDGRWEIVSEDRPLGRFFSVRCGGFETLAAQAVATRIQRWNGRQFVDAGQDFADFWQKREDADVAALVALAPERRERPGLYLSRALTVFFDEASQDRKRPGWEQFSRRLAESGAPAGCVNETRERLRQALLIPKDWE